MFIIVCLDARIDASLRVSDGLEPFAAVACGRLYSPDFGAAMTAAATVRVPDPLGLPPIRTVHQPPRLGYGLAG